MVYVLVGAIKLGRRELVSESYFLIDSITLSYVITTLGHLLIVSTFGAAIIIVHINCKGHCRGQAQCQWQLALNHLARRLLRRKIPPTTYQTLDVGGAPAPPEAICMRGINDGGPCANAAGIGQDGHD